MKLILALALAVGTSTLAEAEPNNGRYQVVFSPMVRADTFLLDTATGTIWQSVSVNGTKVLLTFIGAR